MKTTALFLLLAAALSVAAQTPPPHAAPAQAPSPQDETATEARRLLSLLDADRLIKQTMQVNLQRSLAAMTRARPDIPLDFWSDLAQEIRRLVDTQELIDRLVPIYQRHFTADEVRQLIAFYQTPIGQKFITEFPQLQREAALVGQQWGEELGKRAGAVVVQRMAEKGYRPEPPPQPPQTQPPTAPPPKL